LRSLATTSKRLASYPSGHPALAGAIEESHRLLVEMTQARGELVFGVGRDGLIFGDEKIESPHARSLAAVLYPKGVAIVRFEQGIERAEVEWFLRAVGTRRATEGVSLPDALSAPGIRHVELRPVDFSAVRLTSDGDAAVGAFPTAQEVWDDLLRALVAGGELSRAGHEPARHDPRASGFASLIEGFLDRIERAGGVAPGPAAAGSVGLPARLGEAVRAHLAAAGESQRGAAVRQVAELLKALPDEMRDRALESAFRMLACREGAGADLAALTAGLSPQTTLRALRQLDSEGSKLSVHALKLLESLSRSKPRVAESVPISALGREPTLAELTSLFRGEDIDRFNPEDHRVLLDHASIELRGAGKTPPRSFSELGDRVESLSEEALEARLVLSLSELLDRLGGLPGSDAILGRLEAVFRDAIGSGRIDRALQIVESLDALAHSPRASEELCLRIEECRGTLADPGSIALLIRASRELSGANAAAIRRLIELLGLAAIENLVSALAEEHDQTRRRQLFDLLVSLGPAIVPHAVRLLADPRWFVVRNMIVLLRTVGDRSSLMQIRHTAYHADLRVRLEAIKTLLSFDEHVPLALLSRAINDPDPKIAETAVFLSGDYGIREAVGPLVHVLKRWDPFGRRRSIRLASFRALGELADPAALRELARFFKDRYVPLVAREERIAAWRSLERYPEPARRPLVEKGLSSRDAEVREVCQRLASVRPPPPPMEEAPTGFGGRDE
jgi:HEAT repeat protein